MAFLDNTGLARLWEHIVSQLNTKLNNDDATIEMIAEKVIEKLTNANGVSF